MIYAVLVLALALLLSLCGNYVQFNEMLYLRERLYGAEEWIDPIAWEETK